MELREMCIRLLKQETVMLDTWAKQPREIPGSGKDAGKAVLFAVLTVAAWVVKGIVTGVRDASAEAYRHMMTLVMGLLGWACWAAVIVFAVLAVSKLMSFMSANQKASEDKQYNRKLEQEKAETRRAYDALLAQVVAERKKHPELSGKHLFFDDPHPLEDPEKLVRGKRITTKGRRMAVEGEMAVDLHRQGELRLNGFYAPKRVLIGEVLKGLRGPLDKYALPIWEEDYIRSHTNEECLLYTIHLYSIKAAPRDVKESKITDYDTALLSYWTEDTLGAMIASGVNRSKNLSSVEDHRYPLKVVEMSDYIDSIKGNRNLTSGEGRRHGWNVMDYMRMGYIMVSADDSKRMLGVILPRREMKRHVIMYSLDLFYTENEAKTKKMGRILDLFQDTVTDKRGLGPDVIDAMFAALHCEEGVAPPFDPLQSPVQYLSRPEWHALLRMQANTVK